MVAEKANVGPVTLLNLPLEVVQHILQDTLLADQPDFGYDHDGKKVNQPNSAWNCLSRYRSEAEPDYVLPYEDTPWTTESLLPYPHSKILKNSFAYGLVEFEHMLGALDSNNVYELGFRVSGWEDHRFCRKSLLSVSLTCKSLYVMVQPVLLRNIELALDRERSSPSIDSLIFRIAKSKALASHVRAFSLMFDWSYLGDESRARDTAEPPNDISDCPVRSEHGLGLFTNPQPDHCWLQPARLIPFLGILPNLRALKLSSPWKPQILNSFNLWTIGDNSPSKQLQNLTEISLHWQNSPQEEKTEFDVLEFFSVFFLPNIRTLLFDFVDAESFHVVPETSQYNGISSVKELTITYWDIGESALSALLRLPADLQKFTFFSRNPFLFDEEGKLRYEGISRSLLTQPHSLKSVIIDAPPGMEMDDVDQTPYPDKIWKQFKELEELSTPIQPLSGEDDGILRRSLSDQLPPSLAKLTLLADEKVSFKFWADELTNLICDKKMSCPKLKKIRLEVCYQQLWGAARRGSTVDDPTMREACLRDFTFEMERLGWFQLPKENSIKIEVFFGRVHRS